MGVGKLPVDDAVHLLELFHQVFLVVEAPCGITDQHIHISGFCGVDCVKDHRGRVCAVRSANHVHPRAVCPLCQLVSGSSPEGVRGGNQYFFALFFQDTCKFSDRGSLAYTVDSYDKYDRLLLLKVICGLSDTHLLLDALNQQLLTLRRMPQMLLFHFLLHALDNIVGRIDTDIPHDQDFLQLLIEVIVNLRCTIEYSVNPCHNIVSCLC